MKLTLIEQLFLFFGALGICGAIYLLRIRNKKLQEIKPGGKKPGGTKPK